MNQSFSTLGMDKIIYKMSTGAEKKSNRVIYGEKEMLQDEESHFKTEYQGYFKKF